VTTIEELDIDHNNATSMIGGVSSSSSSTANLMALDHIVAATSGKSNKKSPKSPDLVSFVHTTGKTCGICSGSRLTKLFWYFGNFKNKFKFLDDKLKLFGSQNKSVWGAVCLFLGQHVALLNLFYQNGTETRA
jgi:hypothetical protein